MNDTSVWDKMLHRFYLKLFDIIKKINFYYLETSNKHEKPLKCQL